VALHVTNRPRKSRAVCRSRANGHGVIRGKRGRRVSICDVCQWGGRAAEQKGQKRRKLREIRQPSQLSYARHFEKSRVTNPPPPGIPSNLDGNSFPAGITTRNSGGGARANRFVIRRNRWRRQILIIVARR